jgi:hypothetical protein
VQSKSYKIIPFAKWGNELTDEAITVTGTGTYQWTGLNNDAIGFRVESVDGSDAYGFITADLTMEALDPYINHMEVVCHTDGGGKTDLKIMREFTANDFSVGGGTFYFSVPGDYIGTECRFTFENLKSNYGDNTYYDNSGTGNARYSFVKSVYYDLFASGTDNNIYSNVEAASDHTYTDKVYVEKAGTKAFTFNNAADINGTTTSTYLKEYPFSLTAYGTEGGAFSDVKLTPETGVESDTSRLCLHDRRDALQHRSDICHSASLLCLLRHAHLPEYGHLRADRHADETLRHVVLRRCQHGRLLRCHRHGRCRCRLQFCERCRCSRQGCR